MSLTASHASDARTPNRIIAVRALPNHRFNLGIVDLQNPNIFRPLYPDMTDSEIREFCKMRWRGLSDADVDAPLQNALETLEKKTATARATNLGVTRKEASA